MAQLFPNVLSGDLITADQMNQILQALDSLSNRVAVLENSAIGGSAVVINDLQPPSGTVQVGTELRVLGRNFGFSIGATRVYIDDTRVTTFKTNTSDTLLIFDIPLTVATVPQGGRSALLTVNNQNSAQQRTLTLLPALTLSGNIDIVSIGTTPQTPASGAVFTFSFKLRSRANIDAAYAIDATVSTQNNQPDWQSRVRILDSSQQAVTQITVPAGQEVPFSVQINPIPANSNGVSFGLTVNATAGGVTGSSGALFNTVGTASAQPDTTISAVFVPPAQLSGTGSVSGSEIQLAQGARAKLSFNITFTVVGIYTVTVGLTQGASNWTTTLDTAQFTIVASDLQATGSALKPDGLFVQPQSAPNAASSGALEFRVQRQGVTQNYVYPMKLTAL